MKIKIKNSVFILLFVTIHVFASLRMTGHWMYDSIYINDIAIDKTDNIYITGRITIDPNFVNIDFITCKYNSKDKSIWKMKHDGPIHGFDESSLVILDSNENICIAGDVQLSKNIVANGARETGVSTIKYNQEGSELWEMTYKLPEARIYPVDLEVDQNNNIYVACNYFSAIRRGYILLKYDQNGRALLQKIYNGHEYNSDIDDILIDLENNIYILGSILSADEDHSFIRKYDSQGNLIWLTRFEVQKDKLVVPRGIVIDSEENLYITNYVMDYNENYNDNDKDNAYIVTLKYDSAGKEIWVKKYKDGNKSTYARNLAINKQNEIFVVGYSKKAIIVIKYDSHGNMIWDVKHKDDKLTYSFNRACDIFIEGENVYAISYVRIPRDPWSAPLLLKVNKDGHVIMAKQFDTPGELSEIFKSSRGGRSMVPATKR